MPCTDGSGGESETDLCKESMAIIISVQAIFNITVTFLALPAPPAVPAAVVAPAVLVLLLVPVVAVVVVRPLEVPPLRADLVGACIQENVDEVKL
jgi:hypothetical protein